MHWRQRWWQPRWDQVETNDEESLACRLSDDEHGHSELDSLGKGCPVVDRSVGVQCEIVELMTAGVQTTIHVDILFEAQGQRPGVELGQEAARSGANDSSPGWFDSVRVDERSAWIEESAHPCLVEARSAEGHEYMDGKKISGSEIQVPMSTQANVGDGMQPSSVLRGLQRSLTDSAEIRRPVVDRPVGVPRKTVELMTARDQTEENDDARVRPVLTLRIHSHHHHHHHQHLSDFESNTIAVTETKTVLLRRRAQVGVEETGFGGHFSMESIARWETLGSQEERLQGDVCCTSVKEGLERRVDQTWS